MKKKGIEVGGRSKGARGQRMEEKGIEPADEGKGVEVDGRRKG